MGNGYISLVKNGLSQKLMFNDNYDNRASIYTSAILLLTPGDQVWMETHDKLYSSSSKQIYFNGFLLEANTEGINNPLQPVAKPGSVWFDVTRTSDFDPSGAWKTITFD